MKTDKILELVDIVKIFPGVKALDKVKMDVCAGEVHALCGENGAGKSTLMKIIAGAERPTSGKILLDGKEVRFASTKDAEKLGIAMIYQEFNMIPDMTVAENMYLGRYPVTKLGMIDKKKLNEDTARELKKLNLPVHPKTKVRSLSVATAQMIEIAKCLSVGAKIIIMDEPTSALTNEETEILFQLIQELKAKGIAVIYISHRMDEIFQIADRITVFRDGKYIKTLPVKETNYDQVVALMVGKDITHLYPERKTHSAKVAFAVKNLTGQGVHGISFQVQEGEILGITGLLGAGMIELAKLIYGAMPAEKGEIWLEQKPLQIQSPMQALKNEIAFVSDDRKQEGLVLERDIKENSSMIALGLGYFLKAGIIDKKKEKTSVQADIKKLAIKCHGMSQKTGNLSGGNQQKVVLAKVLKSSPKICILAEPTRGVDIGAKAEIYQLMNEMTKEGKSILLISSDLPEVIGMSDRILVMREGRSVLLLDRPNFSQERILAYASGGITDEGQ